MMCLISNIVPVGVQTGCSKGWRDRAQCVNGSRLNACFCLRATMPPAAPCWPTCPDHSELLNETVSLLKTRRKMVRYVELICIYKELALLYKDTYSFPYLIEVIPFAWLTTVC